MISKKKRKDFYSRAYKGSKLNWFAWRPIKLRDGRWIWLEKVYKYLETWRAGCGYYYELLQKDSRYSTSTVSNTFILE